MGTAAVFTSLENPLCPLAFIHLAHVAAWSALTVLLAAALSIPASLTPLASAAELPGRPDVPGVKSVKVRQITTPQAKAARAKVAQQKKANEELAESARAERNAAWPTASASTTDLADASKSKTKSLVVVELLQRRVPRRLRAT